MRIMKNRLAYIGLILAILVAIPALIFTVIEISSLKENERMIESIYNRQLDAILFSVNSFSEATVNNWRDDIESEMKNTPSSFENFRNILSVNKIISNIAVLNIGSVNFSTSGKNDFENEMKLIAESHSEMLNKLLNYYSTGYRKIEAQNSSQDSSLINLIFVIETSLKEKYFALIQIDANKFVQQILAPKLQEIGGKNLLLGIKHEQSIIYSTGNSLYEKKYRTKAMWILPAYNLVIAPAGKTIEELASEKVETNLLIILAVSIILLLTAFLLFRLIKKELEVAKMRSDFVSNVSHELRTPLALISMFAETLEMGRIPNDEKKKEYYSVISREAHRLSAIVNNILNFAKMEAGKRKFNFTELSMRKLISEILNNYSYHFAQKGFKVVSNIENDDLSIRGDSEALSEAIINLIDNSIKYSGNKKQIDISAFKKEDEIYLTIKDYGIGIPSAEQKKVFEKFYRSGSRLVHNTKGTGIGLSIVKQIIEAHDGNITLESEIEKGSAFTIKLTTLQK